MRNEAELDTDYKLRRGFWCVVNDLAWLADGEQAYTAGQLKRMFMEVDGRISPIESVKSCNIAERAAEIAKSETCKKSTGAQTVLVGTREELANQLAA